jgi:hypothetical protein
MKWTNEEEIFLKENYNKLFSVEISNKLRKSRSSIFSKAWKLHLKKDLIWPETKSIKDIDDIPEEVQQIILGSLLGDGNIRKRRNASFSEAHSLNQKSYLQWKADKLSLLKPKVYYTLSHNNRTNKGYKEIAMKTRTFMVLNEYNRMFYPYGKKIVSKEILNRLEPLGLAIWIMDDGTYSYSGNRINIATHDFSYNEQLLMKEWFESKFSISPKVYEQNHQFYLSFGVRDTKRLIDTISAFIIPSMRYKIGEDESKRKDAITKYRKYRKRKDVRERRRLKQILYRKTPEVKEKMKLYNHKPEVKERKKLWFIQHQKNVHVARI